MFHKDFFKCSFFYQFHPIAKVIFTFLLFISILLLKDFSSFLLFFIFLFSLFLISKVSISSFLRIFVFLIIFSCIFAFLGRLDIFHFTSIFLKIYFVFLTLSFLVLTTSTSDLYYAFGKLLLPLDRFSIDVSLLSYHIVLSCMFFRILMEESKRIQILFKKRNIAVTKFETFSFLLKLYFQQLWKNSKKRFQKEKMNMKIRGFSSKNIRTNYRINSLFDTLFCSVYVIITIVILIKEAIL